jgi:multidrug resistance protein, MATE family
MRYRRHIRETTLLSLPLVVGQLGHVITSMTDNAFLGFVSLEAQDAGILSGNVFVMPLVCLIGMCQGLTPRVAGAHVNQRESEKAQLLKNSGLLNLVFAFILYLLILAGMDLLSYFDQPADVVELAKPFLNIIAFSLVPLSVFFTLKQYCEGLTNTRAAMYISLSGNVLNIFLNYALIFGKLGFPETGYLGAAWATFISRMFMALAFFAYLRYHPRLNPVLAHVTEARISRGILKMLFHTGVGPATQYIFEVAAFVVAAFMAGWLGKKTFASHGIALSIASFTYMFASGISGGASIRVANFKGVNDRANMERAGYSGFFIAACIMTFFGLVFLLFNRYLPAVFSEKPEVVSLAAQLLLVAALFQLFDGVQCVGLGVLRGLSDIRVPTFLALTAYWLVALPLAYFLGFVLDLGVYGIWFGLSAGLIFAAFSLVWRFRQLARR